jgi:thioredoxin 1
VSCAIKNVSDESFAADVLASPHPVLVDYWAEWCVHCKQMEPALAAIAERRAGRLSIVKMDVDANPITHARYGVRSCPTLMIFHGGEVVATTVGALSAERLEEFVEGAL